jgi:hypothetical protein
LDSHEAFLSAIKFHDFGYVSVTQRMDETRRISVLFMTAGQLAVFALVVLYWLYDYQGRTSFYQISGAGKEGWFPKRIFSVAQQAGFGWFK